MKKLFLLAMSALLVLGCGSKSSSNSGDEEKKDVKELKTEVFKCEFSEPYVSGSIICQYPVGGDKELCDAAITYLQEELNGEADVSDYPEEGQEFVDFWAVLIKQAMQQEKEAEGEYYNDETRINVKASVVEDNDRYLTYLFEYTNSDDDRENTQRGATFRKGDASRLTPELLFKDPASPELLQLIHDALREKYTENDDEEQYIDGIDMMPDYLYITSKGLTFVYYFAYAFNNPPIGLSGVIPYNKVKDLLTDEAQALFE